MSSTYVRRFSDDPARSWDPDQTPSDEQAIAAETEDAASEAERPVEGQASPPAEADKAKAEP